MKTLELDIGLHCTVLITIVNKIKILTVTYSKFITKKVLWIYLETKAQNIYKYI